MPDESYAFDVDEASEMEYEADYAESDPTEVDEMLEALMESEDAKDFAERRRRPRQPRQRSPRRTVHTARGDSPYRPPPATGGFVTQKQLKDALDRVGRDIGRNAQGIKTINARLNTIDGRVNGVVSVAATQGRAIATLDKRMKIDGALELAQSFNNNQLDTFQLLKGVAKSGFLGDPKGLLGNPALIGGLGLVLRNPNILGGVLPRPPGP